MSSFFDLETVFMTPIIKIIIKRQK